MRREYKAYSRQFFQEITLTAQLQHQDKETWDPSSIFSFQDLADALESQTAAPSLPDLYALVERTRISEDDLQPYLGFKAGNYCRHRVMRNEHVEMLVLCWKPGQRTPIHDHNGSHGAVFVHEGIMWETTFEYDAEQGLGYKAHRELRHGGLTGSELPDIHQLGNPDVSGQDLITIHIYAPPLGVLKTYKLGSSTIDLYTPADPDFL
jgi:cysteine dioxygenase